MSVYDAEYFFLRLPKGDERLPFLVPDEATADRRFRRIRQAPGTPPLVFHNGWRDEVKRRGVRTVVPDVMFSGADMVISAHIKEELARFRPSHVAPHPSVYIDDNDVRHDGYWFLTFSEELDCWDRATSCFEQDVDPVRVGGATLHQVYEYRLDGAVLDRIPLEQRLLFKMGGTLTGMIVCHISILKIFTTSAGAELDVVAITDY